MMKHLFNFKKPSILRHAQDKFGAVYNSEYARFASRQSLEQVYSALYAHRCGLSEYEVEKRRRKFGENIVVHEERTNPMKLFVSAFINPFIGVLTALILISFVLDVVLAEPGEQDWTTIIIISTMVVFSAILRFVQELKAGRSSDALLKMVKNTCYVERANNESGEIPVEELVPGDIVLLSAGDMIPADLRIVETKDFFVSQSSLTGESDSIEKTPGPTPSPSLHGRGWGWVCCVFLLMTGGLHLHAQQFGVEYTTELQTNFRESNFVNLLRLNAEVPINKSVSIEASTISIAKTRDERLVDDLQTFSNIEEDNLPHAIAVCGANWQINDKHSFFMGIRNMNEDYFTSPVTSFFTNSSCGIYPTISANYPIANYPVASVGIHYCYDGSPIKAQASIYNGNAYNCFTGRDNVFRICPKDDGVFGVAEVEYQHKGSSYFMGACAHYKSAVLEGEYRKVSSTLWSYAEQQLTNRVSLIAAYSHAFSGVECSDFIGIGGKYTTQNCELGFFSDMACYENVTEFATEFTGKYMISPCIFVQPSVHAIFTGHCFHTVASLRLGMNL